MNPLFNFILFTLLVSFKVHAAESDLDRPLSYSIVDTGLTTFYSNTSVISKPSQGEAFFGQDAQYQSNKPSYTDNNDGMVTDNVTGLMWQQDMGEKMSFEEATRRIAEFNLAGHYDWRIPSIKELYSLIQFSGMVKGQKAIEPFIDTQYFNQLIGNRSLRER